MSTQHQSIRNTVARSPLLRKGGAHQRVRSGERQRDKLQTSDALQEWLEERQTKREKPPDG